MLPHVPGRGPVPQTVPSSAHTATRTPTIQEHRRSHGINHRPRRGADTGHVPCASALCSLPQQRSKQCSLIRTANALRLVSASRCHGRTQRATAPSGVQGTHARLLPDHARCRHVPASPSALLSPPHSEMRCTSDPQDHPYGGCCGAGPVCSFHAAATAQGLAGAFATDNWQGKRDVAQAVRCKTGAPLLTSPLRPPSQSFLDPVAPTDLFSIPLPSVKATPKSSMVDDGHARPRTYAVPPDKKERQELCFNRASATAESELRRSQTRHWQVFATISLFHR